MQDKLKRHIESQGNWDDQEPSLEHRSQFAELLNKELHKKPKGVHLTISYSFMRVAAIAVLLITGISFAWFWDQSRINEASGTPSMALADVSEKYKQVEFFYQEQMSVRLAELATEDAEEEKLVYQEAIQKLEQLDRNYSELEKDLAQNPGNSRIVYAMIKNYQLRITVLETLLQKINIKETQKIEENEKADLYPIFPVGIHLIPAFA
jgi:hypothetical protein